MRFISEEPNSYYTMNSKKGILWFAKDQEMIKANGIYFSDKNQRSTDSLTDEMKDIFARNLNIELDQFTYTFHHSRWNVYWTCMDLINHETGELTVYHPLNGKYLPQPIKIIELHQWCSHVIFKYLGSVESQHDKILKSLKSLKSYAGVIINHPDTIEYALRKDYYMKLKEAGFPVIENTRIFENTVKYEELVHWVELEIGKHPRDFIIKPVTGELANSLDVLSEIGKPRPGLKSTTLSARLTNIERQVNQADAKRVQDETPDEWLRRKESKVGGWIVQEYHHDVWNGEYRLVFFGKICVLGLRKKYLKFSEDQIIPSEKYRVFDTYRATDEELELARDVRDYWEKNLGKKVHFFRFDFIKSEDGSEIKILEFEAVNPGLGFGALSMEKRRRVCAEFVSYLDYYDFS